ncbi:MAG: ABC transporter permease subunit [Pirellulaceae bacterium]|nr:ABC transporter permease subunit [Pirellulaceae bacterium]
MKAYLIWAAILLVLACIPWRFEAAAVRVGSKAFTESVILGEVLQLLAEDAGYRTQHLRQLGGSRIVFQALQQRDIMAYVEYTGTIDQELLAEVPIADSHQRAAELAKLGIAISPALGFNNTYALAMRREQARRLGIERISDLSKHPDLRFGFSNEFIDRVDGWPGLRERYGLTGFQAYGLDHDLAYKQLAVGAIDVMDAYTTDARVDPSVQVLLEDDKHYFPEYAAVILYAEELTRQQPDLVQAWLRLTDHIDQPTMAGLNSRVELDRQTEAQVAAEFLRQRLQTLVEPSVQSRPQRITQYVLEHLDMVRRSLLPAILIAIPLGILVYRTRWLGQFVLAVAGIVQTIPALALLVLLIPAANALGASSVGRGSATAIIALFLYSLLPMVRNTYAGLKDVPQFYRDSAEALGLSWFWRLSYIELPLATRSILAGIKTAAVLNIGYATLGALIGAGGLGQPILTGIRLNRFDLILDGAVPAAVMALAAQGIFELLERWVLSEGLQ